MTEVTDESYEPADHYDRVTHAWGLLLGAELHYGVFATPDEELDRATHRLTERMEEGARFEKGLRVLDVGCGTGAQARHLATTHGVDVVGITTSPVGVATARELTEAAGLSDQVSFEQRDATANEFPDDSFDRVWILESSHLMRDREALVSEATRVLRPGGRLVWCDIVRHRVIPFLEVRDRRDEFATLREAFGDARMEPLADYVRWFEEAGLTVEQADDLTEATLPTFQAWRDNAARHRDAVVEALGERGHEAFVRSADILESLWRDGTFGYGLIAAAKPAP
ncbi:class I SAM-dependent methyltransferase [Nocardioides antri]|uniref:Methyltransferase domain-containing protein n=1 Tax=Nocardioides antri TaxID=2607659 RepID=A0A5B1M3K8_9ACTN|nr:class I SAM-dependent methyltransferase [Nocardioides antri]KAA1427483.1 methyltransferase domain-containing protein [Nocardioides antri]